MRFGLLPSKEEKAKAKAQEPLPRKIEFVPGSPRTGQPIRMTRKELCDRVWEGPMSSGPSRTTASGSSAAG